MPHDRFMGRDVEVRPEPVRVFLVDDHQILREGARLVIEGTDDLTVVGEANNAAEAFARIPATRPDVAVVDLRLDDGSGVDICRWTHAEHPEVRCLVLSAFFDPVAFDAARAAGARGYVLKSARSRHLVDHIRAVHRGAFVVDPSVREANDQPVPADAALLGTLSPMELEILGHVAAGRTNREIARAMVLSEKTVKNRVSAILMKLGVTRRTEAAVLYARASTLTEGDVGLPQRGGTSAR